MNIEYISIVVLNLRLCFRKLRVFVNKEKTLKLSVCGPGQSDYDD